MSVNAAEQRDRFNGAQASLRSALVAAPAGDELGQARQLASASVETASSHEFDGALEEVASAAKRLTA